MAEILEEVPLIVIQPSSGSDKMLNSWSSSVRLSVAMFLSLGACAALYVYAKIFYLKTKKLAHIGALASQTEIMIEKLYTLEKNVSLSMEELYDMIEEAHYYDGLLN